MIHDNDIEVLPRIFFNRVRNKNCKSDCNDCTSKSLEPEFYSPPNLSNSHHKYQ